MRKWEDFCANISAVTVALFIVSLPNYRGTSALVFSEEFSKE